MRSLQLIFCFLVVFFIDWSNSQQYAEPDTLSSVLLKRAGFVGMRGKKADDWEYVKRGRNSGFMGMRGKKSMDDEWQDGPSFAQLKSFNDYVQGKRAGFVGMRGKKSYSQYAEPMLSWSREEPTRD